MHLQQQLMEDGDLGFDDNEDLKFLKKLKAMNVYGWTKNEVDIRNIYLKKNLDFSFSMGCIKIF